MKITKEFFNDTTLNISKKLIGKIITFESSEGVIKGIINETEAYTQDDESSHSFGGKRTKKNEVMFWDAGYLYVYFTYGMYYCANIVTGQKDRAEAVLIRSIIPIEGEDIIKKNRNWTKKTLKGLCDGPAKFCISYGIDKNFNGLNLLDKNPKIYLEDLNYIPKKIHNSTRIGISKAQDLEWRYYALEFDKKEK